nr:ribonuclease H-like domain-containing protein [Tanacetum cinerariifolium]
TVDLYPVTQQPSLQTPVVLLSFSSTTWHKHLGHLGDDVLCCLESSNLISCNKSKLSALCHAYQLGIRHGLLQMDTVNNKDLTLLICCFMWTILFLQHHLQHFYIRSLLLSTVTLSRSSAESKYQGVANVVAETAWIRNLIRGLHNPLFTTTLVYCENMSVVYMSTNSVQHQRTKHLEIDIHFFRDYVTSGQVRVLHVPSRFQYADIFTKGLPIALFLEFRSSLNV